MSIACAFKKKKRTLHPALFIYSFHPYFSVLSKRALGRTKEACWINSVPYLYKSGGKNKKKRKHVCAAQKWKWIWAIADRTNRKMMESVHKKRLVFSFNHIRSTNVASDVLSCSKMFFSRIESVSNSSIFVSRVSQSVAAVSSARNQVTDLVRTGRDGQETRRPR